MSISGQQGLCCVIITLGSRLRKLPPSGASRSPRAGKRALESLLLPIKYLHSEAIMPLLLTSMRQSPVPMPHLTGVKSAVLLCVWKKEKHSSEDYKRLHLESLNVLFPSPSHTFYTFHPQVDSYSYSRDI